MMEIISEIEEAVKKEKRSSEEIYKTLQQLGVIMYFSKQWSKEQIVSFCASLIKLYENLKPNNTKEDN